MKLLNWNVRHLILLNPTKENIRGLLWKRGNNSSFTFYLLQLLGFFFPVISVLYPLVTSSELGKSEWYKLIFVRDKW